MKVYYPKLYNMAHLLALNVLLLPKDLTIIFISKGSNVYVLLFENFFSSFQQVIPLATTL